MDESRAELSTYRDILEIADCVKKADIKKEKMDPPFSHAIVKKVADTQSDTATFSRMRRSQEKWSIWMILRMWSVIVVSRTWPTSAQKPSLRTAIGLSRSRR